MATGDLYFYQDTSGNQQRVAVASTSFGRGLLALANTAAFYAASPVVLPTSYTTAASGTAYTLTASYAALDFGTTDPIVTLTGAAGQTFFLFASVQTALVGATYAGVQTVSFKLRRTNNTAADVDTERAQSLAIVTALSEAGPSVALVAIPYTTVGTNDAITIQGILSVTPSAGSVTATNAIITAIPR